MAKVIGLVNLHSDIEFTGLTERRPVASVSFLGRYGIIDFVLSNMSNSKIDAIGVMIQKKPRSLFKHLGNGNSWNFNQKAGGVSLLYNEKYANDPKYNHDINNLVENIHFLETSNADYVVIAPAHIVTTMDYNDVITAHEKSGASITMTYRKAKDADVAWVGCDVLEIDNYFKKQMKENVKMVVPREKHLLNVKAYELLNYSMDQINSMDANEIDRVNHQVYDYFKIRENAINKEYLLDKAIEAIEREKNKVTSGNGYVDILLVMSIICTVIMVVGIITFIVI